MSAKGAIKVKSGLVEASPVKSFFVTMLTRDIMLGDAILDLLDNCVDGILRQKKDKDGQKPYNGYWAHIKFDERSFSIKDNCGGIPWKLKNYAFRMGRAVDQKYDQNIGSVGVYGIGMKRAIFKIGKQCTINTQCQGVRYKVEFTKKWMQDETDWQIPIGPSSRRMREDGAEIEIKELNSGVAALFGGDRDAFQNDFETLVAKHYSFIIEKGFEVKVNDKRIPPIPITFIFQEGARSKPAIRPFVYKTLYRGVTVCLVVGFTRPIPSRDELDKEDRDGRYSTIDAGWSIICNDRAVLYNDKTPLTGWGVGGVPQYHTQFIAVAGLVEFQSKDPAKLPTTTTKRGVEADSELYLLIRDKMQEGMKLFTRFTNKWKGNEREARKIMSGGEAKTFQQIKDELPPEFYRPVKTKSKGSQFKPTVPIPPREEPELCHIKFKQTPDEVKTVSRYLFEKEDVEASRVGKRCFIEILREASE